MNPFESISFFRAKSYGSWTENMKFELNNPTLALFNLKSKSTLYNTISIFITLAYIAFLHVIIYITTCISFISKIEGRCCRCLNRIIIKIFEFLTFSYYIRLAIQLNGFILISSINEVFYMNTSQKLQLLSFIFAVLMIICSVFLIFILIFLSLSSYQVIENRHNKLGEFFCGLKPMKKNRIYTSISMLRRLLFVTFLITLTSLHSQILIGALTAIEVVYIIYVVFVRPFYETKDNVIEIVNEFIYILLLGSLIVYNTEKDWTSTVAHIYMQVVFSNNLIDCGIIQIFLIKSICVCTRRRLCKSNKIQATTSPVEQMQSIEVMMKSERTKARRDIWNQEHNIGIFEDEKEEAKRYAHKRRLHNVEF